MKKIQALKKEKENLALNYEQEEECLTNDLSRKLNQVILVFCYQNCSDLLWEKNCSNDGEKLLKFEAEGREFAKFLRSLEQLIQKVIGQNNFG